jgi:hypothetical protein
VRLRQSTQLVRNTAPASTAAANSSCSIITMAHRAQHARLFTPCMPLDGMLREDTYPD